MPNELSTPTVGIALTATFGTLSLRYVNGAFEDIGRINGTNEYISMIRRLSSPDQKHLAPPYSTMEEMWADLPREGPRALKRAVGFPASSDVKILTEMLKPLLELYPAAEGPIHTAVISYPPAVALYEEDIIDAATYLNMRLQSGAHLGQPREVVAAYAGYGRGLYRKQSSGKQDKGLKGELRELPETHVLHVEYTSATMIFHVAALSSAKSRSDWDIHATTFYDMGSDRRAEDGYKLRIKERLASLLRKEYGGNSMPGDMLVVMTGDQNSVAEKSVQGAIEEVLKLRGVHLVELLVDNPEYIAARGAAELGWRGRESSH